MPYRILLFAVAKQRAGRDWIEVELPAGGTVRDLREALARQVPPLAELLPHVRIAVNSEYATDATPLGPASEIALIPPVSGG
ncbi:MAG: molybdopterin converting factor subunit 1 [Pirellulaceae bacterium]|nr:molybdopterin converting factor subunit 1 [Pirellulaceae bacterium]